MSEIRNAVEAKGLSKRFGRSWALLDLSFSVPAGSIWLVAGHNGSGKSTLLRILAGSLEADRGELRILGRGQRRDWRGLAGLVSHHSFTYDALDGLQNLQVAARFLGKSAATRDLLPLLEEVGLGRRARDPVDTYSAGMRKRLSFARLLLQDPPIVLLDEPFGQLDPQGFDLVDAWVHRLRKEGRTVILASHQLARAASLCDQALALRNGRLAWKGPAGELRDAWGRLEAEPPRREAG